MDEQHAIQRLKQGDISGLEVLVNRYQTRAVRTAYLIVCDAALAEDVAQEAFLRAFRSIAGFDAGRSFEAWFLRIVVNLALKAVKQSARQVTPGEDALNALLADIESVETQVEWNEGCRQLWNAMRQLSPRQRAVIVQKYYLGMNESDMAQEADSAKGTIRWLLHTARRRLRRLLKERDEE
jgi:RNA polymerase sigma-70 factor (ECF subfamily)